MAQEHEGYQFEGAESTFELVIRKQLGKDVVSFSVTPSQFLQMESNVDGSFLQRNTWKSLLDKRHSGAVPNGASEA